MSLVFINISIKNAFSLHYYTPMVYNMVYIYENENNTVVQCNDICFVIKWFRDKKIISIKYIIT